MENLKITYEFAFSGKQVKSYVIEIDPVNLSIHPIEGDVLPEWTLLDNKKCSHCPYTSVEHLHCPVAANISHLVDFFKDKISHQEVEVKVITADRVYSKKVPVQQGVFSIFGLIMATSACPHFDFLKPMARFHLPFSSSEETIVRSISLYLLRQFFNQKRGQKADFSLVELEKHYEKIQTVNKGIISRIRGISAGDADVNAITILHSFATLLTMALSSDLSKIESIFNIKS